MNSRRGLPKRRREGFTLVELLVVMGIIAVAAGMMAPAITSYYRNQALDQTKGGFASMMRRARLQAVTDGRDISVVFFKEGMRIFDEVNRIFVDKNFKSTSGPLADNRNQLYYVLGCSDGLKSNDRGFQAEEYKPRGSYYIPPWDWYAKRQSTIQAAHQKAGRLREAAQYTVDKLVRIIFHRDGTLTFGPGSSDVSTTAFRAEKPEVADISIWQNASRAAAFVDIRSTGASKTKIVVFPDEHFELGGEEEEDE